GSRDRFDQSSRCRLHHKRNPLQRDLSWQIVSPSFEDRVKAVSQATGKPLKQVREDFVARQPMARLGTAEEVAALAVFLASDESSYITGQPHLVDGGLAL